MVAVWEHVSLFHLVRSLLGVTSTTQQRKLSERVRQGCPPVSGPTGNCSRRSHTLNAACAPELHHTVPPINVEQRIVYPDWNITSDGILGIHLVRTPLYLRFSHLVRVLCAARFIASPYPFRRPQRHDGEASLLGLLFWFRKRREQIRVRDILSS